MPNDLGVATIDQVAILLGSFLLGYMLGFLTARRSKREEDFVKIPKYGIKDPSEQAMQATPFVPSAPRSTGGASGGAAGSTGRIQVKLLLWLLGVGVGIFLLYLWARPTPTLQSPVSHVAYSVEQVTERVTALWQITTSGNKSGLVPFYVASPMLRFCTTARKLLEAKPEGWQQSLMLAWVDAKKATPPVANQALAFAMRDVDIVLAQ